MQNTVWPRPIVRPIPTWVPGLDAPRVSLNGSWKFTTLVPERFWEADPSGWGDAVVPGDLTVQGFSIVPHEEYPYKRLVSIPSDFANCRIFLRSEAGYRLRRLWVNGRYLGEHHGAFSVWDADITDCVTPGQPAWITLSVTADDGRTAIEYHHTRGLVRGVSLFALPETHLTRLVTDTDLDADYRDAKLTVTAACACATASTKLRLTLRRGDAALFSNYVLDLSAGENRCAIDVAQPLKWDGEHPHLYELTAELYVEGIPVERYERHVGFRKIEYDDDGVYLNGDKLMLRGVNWHQDHPTLGEVPDAENDKKSLRMLMEANVNFIRTSHYPQTDEVLDLCDRLGLYVEDETSVFFIDCQNIGQGTQHDDAYTARYMDQFASMIEKDRSHASVIIWSLGNESVWGANMRRQYDYVKQEDPTRPVIWSYPHETDNDQTPLYDIFSVHYQKIPYRHGQQAKPELCDEYCHITHMNPDLLRYDPALRDFYGEEIKYLFEQMVAAPRNMGGAIWYSEDTMFMRNDGCYAGWPAFNQNWGIIDIWKRPRPEWWNVKKEYSPVYINENRKRYPLPSGDFALSIENRFNHANLSEATFSWRINGRGGSFAGPDAAPGTMAAVSLPIGPVAPGDVVVLKVHWRGSMIDAYRFTFGEPAPAYLPPRGPAPSIREDRSFLWVEGEGFSIKFFKRTAQILSGVYKGVEVLTGGPMLNLGHPGPIAPLMPSLRCERTDKEVVVRISGICAGVTTHFSVAIDGTGRISTTYTIEQVPEGFVTAVGIAYMSGRAMDQVSWQRDGLWSYYPEDYLCGNEGWAPKRRAGGREVWRERPDWPWALDEKDFSNTDGAGERGEQGTNMFRCSKTNVYRIALIHAASGVRLRVEGDGKGAAQTNVAHNGCVCLCMNSEWTFKVRGWVAGTKIKKDVLLAAGHTDTLVMRMTDRREEPLAYRPI